MSVENLSRITRCTGRNIKLHDQGGGNDKSARKQKAIAGGENCSVRKSTEDGGRFSTNLFPADVRIAGGWKLIRGFDRKPIRGFVIWASRPRQPNRCPRLLIFKPAFNPATCSPICFANPSSFVTTKMNETKSLSILGWIDRSNFLCNAR